MGFKLYFTLGIALLLLALTVFLYVKLLNTFATTEDLLRLSVPVIENRQRLLDLEGAEESVRESDDMGEWLDNMQIELFAR